ncbi:hypothetical protein [Sinisalibacter aestuarii]|uniref:HEAT repeat domain-containing protein n=1 Tax=Sinisalibacter aestuarii TaxID=2949426 RepID=A0ABQ5LZ20_9RHOB|nr:hypothetical protein [Sinisalibacter aestuarii]GKY89347.1 hypothetical protein STA1M1_32160 [Sinisalibacter aestuarii]
MINRYSRTGLFLFGVALYGGPVLAGLAGHGWAVLPVFAALFLLYVSATRKPDLSMPAGWAGLGMMAAMQVVLVVMVWAAGMLVANVAGAIMLPLWAPIAITATAAGAGAWAYRDAAEMDVMLDSAIRSLEGFDTAPRFVAEPEWPDTPADVRGAFERALEALRSAPQLNTGFIDPVVQELEMETGAQAFDIFYDTAGQNGDDNEPLVDFGLLRYIASPAVLSTLIGRGEGGLAPQLLLDAPDAGVRAEARARVTDLVDAGAPDDQLPDPDWLDTLERRFPDEGYRRLASACVQD